MLTLTKLDKKLNIQYDLIFHLLYIYMYIWLYLPQNDGIVKKFFIIADLKLLILLWWICITMYQKSNKIIILKTKQMLNIDLRIKPCSLFFFNIHYSQTVFLWCQGLRRVIKLTDFFNCILIHVCVCVCMHAQVCCIFGLSSNPRLSL